MNQPAYTYAQGEEPVSLGDWLLTIIITSIPIIGVIMLFVWAFGGGTNTSKSNWAKATLLLMAIGFMLVIMLYALIFVAVIASNASY